MSKEKLVERIRKLRAKANDSSVSEAEAAAFAAKVQELLIEHGLDEAEVGDVEDAEEIAMEQFDPGKTSPARQVLLWAVCKYYMCEAVRYDKGRQPWRLVGRPTNVLVAKDMYEYLVSTVVRMSNAWHSANRHENKIDWRRGCFQRLAERLEQLRREQLSQTPERKANGNPGNLPALMHDENAAVRAFIKQSMPNLGTTRTSVRQGAAAQQGRAAADGIGLHRQVGGKGRLMIGAK